LLASQEPLGSPPASPPPGPPSSTPSGLAICTSSHSAESDESSAGFQPATVGDTMQPVLDTDAMHDLRQFQIVFAQVVPVANSCPLEMTTWDAVKAHAGPVMSTADMLGELDRYPEYLGWATTHGPAEGFGELPPCSLARNERATPRSSSVSPVADGSESAAGSVTSFACDALVATTLPAAAATIHPTPDLTGGLHQTGHVPPLPLPLPALSIESAIAKAAGGGQMAGIPMQRSSVSDCFDCEVDDFELDSVSATRTVSDSSVTQAAAVPPKEKMARPHNKDVDGMLWDGAEAAGWKRHPTKYGAWADPQGKYHESASAARRKMFATPDEAKAISKRSSVAQAGRNARFRERKRQVVKQGRGRETDGTSTASGDFP